MGNRMEGRVVIVTGSGRGIGREVAHWMAADGASVVVNDLGGAVDGEGTSDSPAEQTAQEIRDKGGSAVANFDSVADYESAGKIVQTAIDNFGRLDAVCHVAGILRDRMIFNMTEAEWDAVLQVHLYGAFNMVRQAVPHMINQGYGRLVLYSSGSGLGSSGQANYSAAKEGMVGFVRSLAKELAPYGITANAVYPGGATRMTATVPDSSRQLRAAAVAPTQQRTQGEPIQGPPEASDPANNAPKAVYLCSEAASDITGQVIGTSGWQMTLYSPRHVTKSIHKNGRWTLDELDELIPISLAQGLSNPMPPAPPRE
ncbi:MAG: SDR family NAD(P)-dependent oxidoreductase [SAR202 cluster bacterium]|nr:SDR family NAD(P)-dependent oxidoreductase [SAR202 cluster bacterium]MDP6514500.1 SDR family NAD(P)-dependent oxidoreductase [SAR202 cluster bacterium]